MARLVTDPRAVIDGRQHVAARLGAVGQHREGAGPGRALGHEVALDEDLDAVLELEQVAEEAARGAGRFPRGQPVALGDAGPLEHFTVHLEVSLLVRQLEQRALLQLVEGRVGGRGRDVVGRRQLRVVVVGELVDGVVQVTRAHVLVVERILRNRGALGQVALALAGLQRDVALPGEIRRVDEPAGILERDSLSRHAQPPY